MDDDLAARTDDVEKFLMTIPKAEFIRQKGDLEPKFFSFEVFEAIRENIASRLDTKNDHDDWLSQLIELELEGEDVPETASHIARLLTCYVVNRPWVFRPEVMRTKPSHFAPRFHPEITVPPMSDGHKKSILDYKNVVDLLIHGEAVTNMSDRVSSVMAEGSRRDYSERIDKKPEILAESDSILGIAGFYPFHEEPELADDGISRAMSTFHDSLNTEWEFIGQCRCHIKLMGHPSRQSLAISFAPRYARDRVERSHPMDQAKLYVEQGIKSLASQIDALQEKSGHLGQLLFIYLHSSGRHVEVGSIDMKFVEKFIHAYVETKNDFDQYLRDALEESRAVPTFSQNVTNTVTSRRMPRPSPLFGDRFTIGSYLYRLTQHYFWGGQDVILSPLLEALHPILESIGITQFNPHEDSHAAAIDILHITALAVQSLCLMVQSYLRESVTPMQFEFLTTPIYDFVLEGVLPNSYWSTSIHVSSRRLSCLGEMLGKEVLVFEVDPSAVFRRSGRPQPGSRSPTRVSRLDLVATTAQIASLWGPAELAIRRKDEQTIWEQGLSQTTDKEPSPSAHQTTSIISIKIQAGIIVPTGFIDGGIQRWHWRSMKTTDEDKSVLTPDIHTSIDLHTQIRVGGKGSCLTLHPIGPATWNQDCPSSTKSILDLSPSFSSSFRVIGVTDPSISLKSFTLGVQVGQIVNLVAQGTFETTLGKTVKEQTINSYALFASYLTNYDQTWGLLVSVCTGVMTRIRLRELVALFCLQCAPKDIPKLAGRTYEESVDAFTEALCGKGSLNDWFESLISASETNEKEQERESLQKQVQSLFLGVLKTLENTGISEDGNLVLACLSKDASLRSLTLSATDYPWVKVLSDSSLTATFACLSLHCFQDRDCKCRSNKWNIPKEFRLATKLDIHMPAFSPREIERDRPILGTKRTYWINSSHLNLMARVVGSIQESDSDLVYYISVKKSVLPLGLVRALRKRPTLREDGSSRAVKCIISGGTRYLDQIEKLIREGEMVSLSP